MSRPEPELAPLFTWVRQSSPPGSLFLVPPIDARFYPFRLIAERGIYISLSDINQLSYDASVYGEGHNRLVRVGLRVLGRHQFEDGYYRLSRDQLVELRKTDAIDYAVFDRSMLSEQLAAELPAYADDHFVVLRLTNLALGAS